MAEKEHVKEVKEKVVTEKVVAGDASDTPAETAVVSRRSRKFIWGIVGLVVLVYALLVIGGFWFLHAVADHQGANGMTNTQAGMSRQGGRPGFGGGERTYNLRQSESDGLTTTTTNTTYTQTQGVVTAVNSDSIVVAGGGKTQTIKTNSSTTYVDDTKAAVNDTVVIVGTKDGDTITATQIAVYN